MTSQTTTTRSPTPANRLGLDYRAEAERLGPPVVPIIDAHAHINGPEAATIYKEVCELYGVVETYSQTRLDEAEAVRAVMGDAIRFVAVPDFMNDRREWAHTEGYLEHIPVWYELGARMLKFWSAPRGRDYAEQVGAPSSLLTLGAPWRRKQMDLAAELGMAFMVHIADPDTWFQTTYADSARYGTKADQYAELERLGDEYPRQWLIAHMGGWPEDLDFLDGFLERHPNFVLDTSATKWMIRELSKHPSDRLLEFLTKHSGRILFGSDIVTMDAHLSADEGPHQMGTLASSRAHAFDLYASRYYALRTMLETSYRGESPIADPDLMLVDPERYDELSAPALTGHQLPKETLEVLYASATRSSLGAWYDTH